MDACTVCSWTRLRLGFPVLEVKQDVTLVGVVPQQNT
jgi:hypothetical protein